MDITLLFKKLLSDQSFDSSIHFFKISKEKKDKMSLSVCLLMFAYGITLIFNFISIEQMMWFDMNR